MTRKSIMDDNETLTLHVQSSECLHEVLQKFGLSGYSDNYSKLRQLIEKYNIDTSHFQSAERRATALRNNGIKKKIPLTEILDGKHPHYKTYHLHQRLINEGIMEEECTECGLKDAWNGKPITLQLDHINGDRHDHRLKNLRILCPNCHTQTETWGRKN